MRLCLPSRTACCVSGFVLLLVATTIGAQQLTNGNANDQQTARLVADMISRHHITQKHIDDRIAQMLFKRVLKDLDPQKLYFVQADIDEFSRYRDQLDDLIKVGNVDFAKLVFDRYLKRMDERVVVAHKLIDAAHDFTIDESMSVDGDAIGWAADVRELNERWRKRIKFDLLNLKFDKVSSEDAHKRLHKRYDTLKRTAHDTEDGEVLEIYLSALAHCFDPHSSYMSPQSVEDFDIIMKLSLQGIGAALRSEDGYTIVASLVKGGAADKDARLKVNDKITAVSQDDGDWVDIVEMKLSKVVRLIRGASGTKVRLRIVNAANETQEIVLVRQKIELTSSEVKGEIIDAGKWFPGTQGRFGIISIPSFYRDFGGAQQGLDDFKSTSRDVAKVLADFRKQGGVDAVVIDLRMNGGGALTEAIEVSGLFIDKGPVVQVKEQNGKVKSHDDTEAGLQYDGPLVVICNRLAASASEIFAGVIKDYRRGIIVGDTTTHGKGTVQNVMPVKNGFLSLGRENRGSLKLTINQFYRVNGDSTQNRGVESDVVIPSLIDHMDLGESFLENALAFDRVDQAAHLLYNMADPGLVATLRELSSRRVAADPKFAEVKKDIERYLVRKNRKTVSLNEETLRKERDDDKAANEVAKDEDEKENGTAEGPVFKDTEYNKEVLHIAADYLQLLRNARMAAKQ